MKRLPKQTYTLEFKQAAIQRMEVAGKKQADVARELGLANTGHVGGHALRLLLADSAQLAHFPHAWQSFNSNRFSGNTPIYELHDNIEHPALCRAQSGRFSAKRSRPG